MKKAVIFTDGGADPNPGPAAIGAVIKSERGRVVSRISRSIGRATNNEAEYQAVIAALEAAFKLGATQVEVRSDSEWLVRQVNGQYRVKAAAIRPLYIKVKQLQTQFEKCIFTHIPREENEAHHLTTLGLR
jgi:ribonuclease HI